MSAGTGSASISSSSIEGLLGNLPPGVSPFEAIKQALIRAIFLPPSGYFLAQTYLFIAIHALIAIVSVLGCYIRFKRGNFWCFRWRNHYLCPNTSILSQLMFACYSILYIVSLITNNLAYEPPTVAAYALSLAAYIPLGLAIHVQTWSTIYARPSVTGRLNTSSTKPVLYAGSPFRRLGPKSMNFIMIFIGIFFTLSIVAGRIVATVVREQMMESWSVISHALDKAEIDNAPLASLITLVPEFENLMKGGERLRNVELTLGKVWSSWAGIWIIAYIPTAFFLVRTLRRQEKHLKRSIHNLNVLDQLVTQSPPEDPLNSPYYAPSRSTPQLISSFSTADKLQKIHELELQRSPSVPSAAYSPESKEYCPLELISPLPTPRSPLSTSNSSNQGLPRRNSARATSNNPPIISSRTAIQKEEVSEKLVTTKRMREIILYQLIATTIMLITYTTILIISERPQFQEYTPLTQIHITDTMLGWAFAAPALFSSAGFLYVSVKAPRSQKSFTKLDEDNLTSTRPRRPSFFRFGTSTTKNGTTSSNFTQSNSNSSSEEKYLPRVSKSSHSTSEGRNYTATTPLEYPWTRKHSMTSTSNSIPRRTSYAVTDSESSPTKYIDTLPEESVESESDRVRLGNKSWVPSKWVKEREEGVDEMEMGLRFNGHDDVEFR